MQKKLKLMLLINSLVLASCVGAPPDFVGCANLGDSLHCATYMTKKKFDIDEKHLYTSLSGKKMTYKQVIAGSVLIPADWFAKLKTHFDNYCHQNECPNGIGDWGTFAKELSAE